MSLLGIFIQSIRDNLARLFGINIIPKPAPRDILSRGVRSAGFALVCFLYLGVACFVDWHFGFFLGIPH